MQPIPETTSPGESPTEAPEKLQGQLGVRDLVFTVLAYNAPLAVMAGYIPLVVAFGNGAGAPATFALVGVLLAVFAVGLTAMSRFMKSPGAFYSYISAGLGRPAGLGGAFAAFAGYTAINTSSYAYGGIVMKGLVEGLLSGPVIDWWIWAVLLWIIASGLSLLQVNISAKVLGVAMIAEVLLVVIWDVAVFLDGGPEGVVSNSFTFDAFTSGSISFALLFGVLCITGFEAVAVFREETKDPVRTVPRATYTAVAILAIMYCIGALAYLTAFGTEGAIAAGGADPAGSFVTSVEQYVGTVAVDIVTVLLVTSVFAALLATQNISSRYLYTLGEDRVVFPKLGRVHPKFGSPFNAAAVVAAITLIGFTIARVLNIDPVLFYGRLAGFGGVCLLTLMTATAAAVFIYFRRDSNHEANIFQSVVSPVIAFAGLAAILYLAITNMGAVIGGTPAQGIAVVLIGAAIIVSGVALALFLRTRRPDAYERIGKQDI